MYNQHMKKIKLNIKFTFDAPVTLTFAAISLIFFLVNTFICKGKLTELFLASPTSIGGQFPFFPTKFISYARLVFYVFGANSALTLMTNLIFILLLGPSMEERYGSVVIGIMIVVSAIFSAVLNACFCTTSLQGAIAVVFMMIFLNSFMSFSKKKIPVSFLAVFILFIVRECFGKSTDEMIGILIGIAGGLCGSLFAFLASPRIKAEKKNSRSGGLLKKAEKAAYLEELDNESPRNQKNNRRDDDNDDETTVVGTLKF